MLSFPCPDCSHLLPWRVRFLSEFLVLLEPVALWLRKPWVEAHACLARCLWSQKTLRWALEIFLIPRANWLEVRSWPRGKESSWFSGPGTTCVQLVDPGTYHKSRKPGSLALFRMSQGFLACYYLPAGDPGTLPLNPLHVVDGSASELRLMSETLHHLSGRSWEELFLFWFGFEFLRHHLLNPDRPLSSLDWPLADCSSGVHLPVAGITGVAYPTQPCWLA